MHLIETVVSMSFPRSSAIALSTNLEYVLLSITLLKKAINHIQFNKYTTFLAKVHKDFQMFCSKSTIHGARQNGRVITVKTAKNGPITKSPRKNYSAMNLTIHNCFGLI